MGKILRTLFADAATEGSFSHLRDNFLSSLKNTFPMPK
jgi:hypothetical protein